MYQTASSDDFNICDKYLPGNFEREAAEVVMLPCIFERCGYI